MGVIVREIAGVVAGIDSVDVVDVAIAVVIYIIFWNLVGVGSDIRSKVRVVIVDASVNYANYDRR